MSATESVRTNREQNRSHRQSTLIQGNVVAFVFRSIDLDSISSSSRTILRSPSMKDEKQGKNGLTCNPEQLLQAFVDANRNSLNRRLVESFDELKMVGWLTYYTLLLSGPNEDIEVLKNAWSQRILRNPKGFILKDVGTIKNFVVEWIPHSQFISLTTALHDTVMELDRNGRCASRDAIVKYLKNVYHDVRIPTEDIIHKCLGKLIEQRKIYHDGVGYRALIDDSPIHKTKQPDKIRAEDEEVTAKFSVKSSVKTRSDNGSVCPSSVVSKDQKQKSSPKVNLSDGSSKDDTTSRAHSDEDRHRFNLPFLDHLINISTPTLKNKSPKDTKKKSPSSTMKSSMYKQNEDDQEIKIIDIAESMSVLKQNDNLGVMNKKEATVQTAVPRNGEPFQNTGQPDNKNAGQPYDKHNREAKPIKRPKPHRSRSFTEPSKQRLRSRTSKASGNDGDFPLRRVMATVELRISNKGEEENKNENRKKNKSDKNKSEKNNKYNINKTDEINHTVDKKKGDSTMKVSLKNKNANKNGDDDHFNEMREKSPKSITENKTLKLMTDSDTPSGTCTSDASSPFQSKKRRDMVEAFSDNNNINENGLTYLCLTGKKDDGSFNIGKEQSVKEHTSERLIAIMDEKLDIEDDSIFDYIESESDGIGYHCEDDMGISGYDVDSLQIEYSF